MNVKQQVPPLNPVMVGYCSKPVVPFNAASFANRYTRNVGNLLFVQGLETIVETPKPLVRVPQSSSFEHLPINTALLAPMSNHIASHVDLARTHSHLAEDSRQVLLIGIGIQSERGLDPSPPESSVKWLKDLHSKGGAIWTRGRHTSAYLDAIGVTGSAPIGCPSLFINPSPELGATLKRKADEILKNGISRLAVAAGNPIAAVGEKLSVEQRLVEQLGKCEGSYVVQNPMPLLCLALGWYDDLNPSVFNRLKNALFKDQDQATIISWFRRRSIAHVDVSQWLLALNSYDLVIGTRIHGVQAGIQAGVPSVCVTHDSRTEELCMQMRIPHISTSSFLEMDGIDSIYGVLQTFDFGGFDECRSKLATAAATFLDSYGVRSSRHIQRIACVR